MSNEISDINEYKKILSSIKNEYVIELSRCLDNLKKFCFEFKELNSRLFLWKFFEKQGIYLKKLGDTGTILNKLVYWERVTYEQLSTSNAS